MQSKVFMVLKFCRYKYAEPDCNKPKNNGYRNVQKCMRDMTCNKQIVGVFGECRKSRKRPEQSAEYHQTVIFCKKVFRFDDTCKQANQEAANHIYDHNTDREFSFTEQVMYIRGKSVPRNRPDKSADADKKQFYYLVYLHTAKIEKILFFYCILNNLCVILLLIQPTNSLANAKCLDLRFLNYGLIIENIYKLYKYPDKMTEIIYTNLFGEYNEIKNFANAFRNCLICSFM